MLLSLIVVFVDFVVTAAAVNALAIIVNVVVVTVVIAAAAAVFVVFLLFFCWWCCGWLVLRRACVVVGLVGFGSPGCLVAGGCFRVVSPGFRGSFSGVTLDVFGFCSAVGPCCCNQRCIGLIVQLVSLVPPL